jgi:hypothetical protein
MSGDQPDKRPRAKLTRDGLVVSYDEMLERFRKQMLEAAGVTRAYQATAPSRPRTRRPAP